MDAVNKGTRALASWDRYHAWRDDGKRKLTVIDESLDIIEEAEINLGHVKLVKAIIPFTVAERYPEQMKVLDEVEALLTQMARMAADAKAKDKTHTISERVLSSGSLALPVMYDLTPLRRELKDMRLDHALLRKNDPAENKKQIEHWDTILRDIQSTLSNWNWYASKLTQHTINTARLIVPDDIAGAVVMDATQSPT